MTLPRNAGSTASTCFYLCVSEIAMMKLSAVGAALALALSGLAQAQPKVVEKPQYGGSLSFYHPRVKGDVNNPYAVTYAALKTPRTLGYISVSIDGDLSETNTALYAGGATRDYAAGDYVHIFKVMTAGYSDAATGEDAFRYTISFLPQGEASIYTVAGSGAATVVLTVADTTPAAGDIVVCEATVNGRQFTRGLRWSVSDGTKAAISQNGILRVKSGATGTFDVTATFEASGASDTEGITIT